MALSAREKAEAARYKPAKKKAVKKPKKKVTMQSAREKAEASFIPKKKTAVTISIIPKAKPKRKTAVSKSVKPKARNLSISKTTVTVTPSKKRQVERKRNVLSDFARLDKYISDLDKRIKVNSNKLSPATKKKINMHLKKLKRKGGDGYEKSGIFTDAEMKASRKLVKEMLKEK